MVVDALRIANWQRSKDGKHASKRPKPISPLADREVRYGRTDRPPAEVAEMLARYGPQEVTRG